jgi:histidinol-phosphatase (PHP family)
VIKKNSNFHSHCTFCDGRSKPEDFVQTAIEKQFRAYGFSSHSPLPFETCWNMSKIDMPDYLAEITRLKNKYAGDLEIYLGLEIDYLDNTYNAAIPYFQSLPLDYSISSVHFLPVRLPLSIENMACVDGPYHEFEIDLHKFFNGNIRRITESFFESSMQMVETGGFDIVGHIDKIYMNGARHPDFDIQADWYQKPFLQLLDLIAGKGYIVEINCKNIVRNGHTFPHIASFKELKKRDIPVMVNSDCHQPDLINDGREKAFALLKEAGYQVTRELVNGKWQEVEING